MYFSIINVSIHAPARGATAGAVRQAIDFLFQSTHPRGVRLVNLLLKYAENLVSIHAPARGATPGPGARAKAIQRFNPRTREGCDHRSPRLG